MISYYNNAMWKSIVLPATTESPTMQSSTFYDLLPQPTEDTS